MLGEQARQEARNTVSLFFARKTTGSKVSPAVEGGGKESGGRGGGVRGVNIVVPSRV